MFGNAKGAAFKFPLR